MKTISHAEFLDQLQAQDVPIEHAALVCPMCGTVQSSTSLIRAGAGATPAEVQKYIGFSCVGRWTGSLGPAEAKAKGVACNWTLGGLFQMHKLEVIIDGDRMPAFELATPEQAQALQAHHEAQEGAQ